MHHTMDDSLIADAFRRLYPKEYITKFIHQNVRPDGRRFDEARDTTVGIDVVSTADASALIRIGGSSAIAGLKLELSTPAEDRPTEGTLQLTIVEANVAAGKVHRAGNPDLSGVLSHQVHAALLKSGAVQLSELCLSPGQLAWLAHLDIYILAKDGALLDAILLAAVAALAGLKLPAVAVPSKSTVPDNETLSTTAATSAARAFRMAYLPTCLTCAFIDNQCLVDPTNDEEALADALISVILADDATMLGVHKQGGRGDISQTQLHTCTQAATSRRSAMLQLLKAALAGQDQDKDTLASRNSPA